MTVLTVAITNAEIPQVLDFGKVLDDEEVVLICLRNTISRLTWPGQVCKLCHLVVHFTDRLLLLNLLLRRVWLLSLLLLLLRLLLCPDLAIRVRMLLARGRLLHIRIWSAVIIRSILLLAELLITIRPLHDAVV